MELRVVQNIKCLKFTPDLVNYYSLGQKHSKNAKILKIEKYLDMFMFTKSSETATGWAMLSNVLIYIITYQILTSFGFSGN